MSVGRTMCSLSPRGVVFPEPPCNLHTGSCSIGTMDNNAIHLLFDSDSIIRMAYPPIKGQRCFRCSLFLGFTAQ